MCRPTFRKIGQLTHSKPAKYVMIYARSRLHFAERFSQAIDNWQKPSTLPIANC